SARGRATRSWFFLGKGPGEQDLGEIRMEPGGALRGRVVDEHGGPLASVEVRGIRPYSPDTPAGREEARTLGDNCSWVGPYSKVGARAGEGPFLLEGWPLEPVLARAQVGGKLAGLSAPVEVTPGQPQDVGDVIVGNPRGENLIPGIALDARGG